MHKIGVNMLNALILLLLAATNCRSAVINTTQVVGNDGDCIPGLVTSLLVKISNDVKDLQYASNAVKTSVDSIQNSVDGLDEKVTKLETEYRKTQNVAGTVRELSMEMKELNDKINNLTSTLDSGLNGVQYIFLSLSHKSFIKLHFSLAKILE